MEYYCVFCDKKLKRRKRKYCSNPCKCKQFYREHPEKCNLWNKKNPKPKVNHNCLTCGNPCGRKRYCSSICRPIRIYEKDYWEKIERLNAKCKVCGGTILIPNVHHINKNHKDNRTENLLVLCSSCHSKVHNKKLNPEKRTEKQQEINKRLNFYRNMLKS